MPTNSLSEELAESFSFLKEPERHITVQGISPEDDEGIGFMKPEDLRNPNHAAQAVGNVISGIPRL